MSAQLFTQLDLVGLLRSDFSKPKKDPRPIGRILLDMGAITQFGLDHALRLQRGMDAKLGEILVNEDLIEPEDLTAALKEQFGLATAELDKIPPDAKTASLLAADIALEHGVVPWLRFGALLLVATPDPSRFQNLIAAQPNSSVQLVPVLASAEAITRAQHALYGPALVWRAERQVMANLSCRSFAGHTLRRLLLAAFLLNSLIALSILAPTATWLTLSWIALGTLVASITLKTAATLAQLFGERTRATPERSAEVTPLRLPRVSVMVPLLHEREIAAALV
ncbi:MAG: glycosyl transferase, partial [Pseudomonadota bacterium]